MLPRVLYDFTQYIDGVGYAGLAEEIVLPKLTRQMEDYQAGGMLGPVKLDFGMDALTLEVTIAEYNPEILKLWGNANASGIGARFLGSLVSQDGGGTDAVEISVRGRFEEIDPGTAKKKENGKLKVKMPLTYFRYSPTAKC
ncbi:MAG: phage major tail tube protein [Rhodospirillaceae bacterium]